MAVPFWVWGAIVGAVGGGVGALLGWLLERAGFKVGRWLSVIGIAAGVGFLQTPAFKTMVDQLTWSDAQTETALIEAAPEVFAYLKASFPEDFQQFVRGSTEAIRSAGKKGDVALRSTQIMQTLRKKYAAFVRLAPEQELAKLMSETIAFYEMLHRDDPANCAQVAVNGPASLVRTEIGQRYGLAMMPQVLALFRTARAGIDTPAVRREPTDADWGSIGVAMASAGAPDSYFQAIAELNANNLETCPAVVMFLRTINETETEESRIVRAAYLAELAAT